MAKKPKKPKTLQQIASTQVDQALAPLIADIQSRGKATTSGLGGIYDALAKANAGIAPAVQDTYRTAAADTGAFAAGYSDAMKGLLGDKAAEGNQILEQNGSPQHVDAGAGAGDVLFGLGGSIPGQALVREGAGFTAAAQMLPAQARTLGAQAQGKSMFDMDEEIRKIEAERPGLIQKALSELQAAQTDQQELALKQAVAQQEFGLDLRKQRFNEAATQVKLNQAGQRIKLDASSLNLRQAQERFDQLLATSKLNLSQDQYDLAVKREARMARSAKNKKKSGGFTALQKRQMSQQAFDTATDAFFGWEGDDGTKHPPRAPAQVLQDMIAAGIPFSIAIKAIQRYGRKPNAGPLWKATLGWTK